jgi:hypothetical protein
MESDISTKRRQGHVGRDDEASVDGAQAPVENADDDLNRSSHEREVVFAREERVRAGDVGNETTTEACRAQRDADYGQELQMPAERFILQGVRLGGCGACLSV